MKIKYTTQIPTINGVRLGQTFTFGGRIWTRRINNWQNDLGVWASSAVIEVDKAFLAGAYNDKGF